MVIVLNKDGTLTIVSPQTLTQGSNNTSDLILMAPGLSQFTSVSVSFMLPDKSLVNGGLMTPADTVTVDGILVNSYYFALTKAYTNLPGTLTVTFNALDAGGDILSSYVCGLS